MPCGFQASVQQIFRRRHPAHVPEFPDECAAGKVGDTGQIRNGDLFRIVSVNPGNGFHKRLVTGERPAFFRRIAFRIGFAEKGNQQKRQAAAADGFRIGYGILVFGQHLQQMFRFLQFFCRQGEMKGLRGTGTHQRFCLKQPVKRRKPIHLLAVFLHKRFA